MSVCTRDLQEDVDHELIAAHTLVMNDYWADLNVACNMPIKILAIKSVTSNLVYFL